MAKVDGAWNCTVSSPMGPQASVMTLKSDGNSFTGTNSGALGSIDVEQGVIDGDAISFKMALKIPMPMELDCKAVISGDTLEGTVAAGVFGSWPLKGTRG